jgi:hypothetical protein
MSTMLPHVAEILSYLSDDINFGADPCGAMRINKTNAIYKNTADDLEDIHSNIKRISEKMGYRVTRGSNFISEDAGWGKKKDKTTDFSCVYPPKEVGEYFPDAEMFTFREISDALKQISEFFSDQEYNTLKEYFKYRNFLRSPHPMAGAPVLSPFYEHTTKEDLRDSMKKRGKILPDDFTLPEFSFWKEGASLTEEQQDMISEFERANGFPFDTKMLRQVMGIDYLANYQIKLILNLANYNYIAASRRAGKSLLATYLAIRQTFIPNQTILYVMPSESYFFQPLTYIDRLMARIKQADSSIKLSYSDGVLRNSKTKSSIKMVSASMRKGIRSFDGDMIIIDEAAYVPESEFMNLSTIIEQKIDQGNYGNLIAITTIDKDTPYNWFYEEMISAELSSDPIFYTDRISIFDNPFFSENSRNRLIEKYQRTGDKIGLMCELYAQFPPKNKKIPVSFFPIELQNTKPIPVKPIALQEHGHSSDSLSSIFSGADKDSVKKEIIDGLHYYPPPSGDLLGVFIGYDPAKKQSKSAFCAAALYKNTVDMTGRSVFDDAEAAPPSNKYRSVILAAGYAPDGMRFQDQISILLHPLFTELSRFSKNTYLCFDENGIGAPVREMIDWKDIKNIPVHYSTYGRAGGKVSTTKDGILYVDKKYMMSNFILAAESGLAVSYPISAMKTVISELGGDDETQALNVLKKSDLMNALYIMYIAMTHVFPGSLSVTPMIDPESESALKNRLFTRALRGVREAYDPNYSQRGDRTLERMKRFGY